MATNITNQQIDAAIPNKGSSTPHAEQPNRKLVNSILKAVVAETNALGTAANKNVGTASGNVMEMGAFGLGKRAANALSHPNDLGNLNTGFYSGYVGGATLGNGWPRTGDFDYTMLMIWNSTVGLPAMSFTQILTDLTNKVTYIRTGRGDITGNYGWTPVVTSNLVQSTTGQSQLYPMTQKATTDAINGISDARDKTEINEIGLGLEVIENINTFSFKLNKRDWYRQQAAKELIEVEEEDGKVTTQEKINDEILSSPLSDFEENDGSLKRDDVYTGFVAQDLKETLEELGLGHLGIVKNYSEEYEGGEDRFYIEHLALLPFLVNSIKQLSARVKELEDAAE